MGTNQKKKRGNKRKTKGLAKVFRFVTMAEQREKASKQTKITHTHTHAHTETHMENKLKYKNTLAISKVHHVDAITIIIMDAWYCVNPLTYVNNMW